MPDFVALTSKGLGEALKLEVEACDLKVRNAAASSVEFECSWGDLYRFAKTTQTATRILKPILDFPAYKVDDLYHNIRKHDFTKYIEPNGSFSIEVRGESRIFRNTLFASQKIKDAVADQFREKFGERPNFDPDNTELLIFARVNNEMFSVSIDVVGRSLSQHEYRTEAGEAPLREHLAAGLIRYTDWNGDVPLLDPMCGSGTFLIEAALQKLGYQRPAAFSFLHWKSLASAVKDLSAENLDSQASNEIKRLSSGVVKRTAAVLMKPRTPPSEASHLQIFGSDQSREAVNFAKRNAQRAGLGDLIQFSQVSLNDLAPPSDKPGIIVVNPPFGERMQPDEYEETYAGLSAKFKKDFKGWSAWVLISSPQASEAFNLKADKRVKVWNGPLEVRWHRYDIR